MNYDINEINLCIVEYISLFFVVWRNYSSLECEEVFVDVEFKLFLSYTYAQLRLCVLNVKCRFKSWDSQVERMKALGSNKEENLMRLQNV